MNTVDRRSLLRAGLALAGSGLLAGCTRDSARPRFVGPGDDAVRIAEARRTRTGPVREMTLTALAAPVDLGGRTVRTWSYGGRIPGEEIRVRAGDLLKIKVVNQLADPTTVHWHGLALRNNADGVPDVTQSTIKAGAASTYEFSVPDPGTYWFHPHVGTQLDRGLYAPLIVEDPREPLGYDAEWVVVLDDWLDGISGTPDDMLAELRKGMGPGMGPGMGHGMGHGGHAAGVPTPTPAPGGVAAGMLMGASSILLGGDAGDVRYPYYLLNGRLPTAPATFPARPGTRLRIRFVNAGSDTA